VAEVGAVQAQCTCLVLEKKTRRCRRRMRTSTRYERR
jgi:hypothetical protein